MSRLVSRILLSILMFPLAALVYIFTIAMAVVRPSPSQNFMFALAGAMAWLVVAVYWCLLWKSSVKWDGRRIAGTLFAVCGAICVGAVGGFTARAFTIADDGFPIFIGGILAITVWLIATVLLWRETSAERAERVKKLNRSAITCPTCGYNLTGLRECRCPECGSAFTLDELMALQEDAGGGID